MERAEFEHRLSGIVTQWSLIFQAHAKASGAAPARERLLERYAGAAYRYLLGAVRDPDAAADLCQEFALRFLRGDFRRADPGRGRFRDYLRTALVHLVTDHHRSRQLRPGPLAPDVPAPADAAPGEADFLAGWREELLDRTWKALAESQPVSHAALRLRVAEPGLSSAEMAVRLSAELARPLTAESVRKALQRAHARFADLLLDEVARGLDDASPAALEEELRALDLLKYCRTALGRRGETAE
jgi:RNA polymerase sigma-70 factor (ECF subfamily)